MGKQLADADQIAALRSFNRTVTERVGALDEHYLALGRSLGASRLLWEIGTAGSDVRQLRARLGLDSGYVSRLLRTLETEGLVEVVPDAADGRVRVARWTPAGRRQVDVLDRLSDDLAGSMLVALDPDRRARLVEAAATVERLLLVGLVEVAVADPTSDDARYCMESYFAEIDERFDGGFDQRLSTSADYAEFTEPTGVLLVARLRGRPVGCGALKFHGRDRSAADIKRMWIAPEARRLGIGRRLLEQLEAEALRRRMATVRLETNRRLPEAIAMYRAAGYVEVDAFNDEHYAHHWFVKSLV